MKSARHTSTTSKANRQNITDVSDSGDLILDVQIPPADEHILYQVSTDILRGTSPYFRNILDPDKFSEGAHVRKAQAKLRERYTSLKDVPAMELPRISVVGVGQLGRRARHEEMMTSFLRILCGTSVDGHPSSPSWLADIVTIADRFDSLEKVKEFVMQHHRLYGIFATKGLNSTFKEELIRQIIYSGALLGVPQWVASCSARLANHGSKRWSTVEEEEDDGDQARWWTLPGGLEEELMYRRESILDTIQSMQAYFLKLYTSKQRQCKLGYDSSPQCDSFQLGEMVRFLTRIGTLRLQGMIYDCGDPEPYVGTIDHLLDTLRQCPSYQINSHHSHCGLRARLIPLLDLIHRYLDSEIGVCAKCWGLGGDKLMWSKHPRPEHWTFSPPRTIRRNKCEQHERAREMFTARERNWEPQSSMTK